MEMDEMDDGSWHTRIAERRYWIVESVDEFPPDLVDVVDDGTHELKEARYAAKPRA